MLGCPNTSSIETSAKRKNEDCDDVLLLNGSKKLKRDGDDIEEDMSVFPNNDMESTVFNHKGMFDISYLLLIILLLFVFCAITVV